MFRALALHQSEPDEALHSDEGLTLKTPAFQIVYCGNSTFISTFDKTKFSCWTYLNLIQHAFNKLSTFFALSTMLDDLFKRTKHLVQQSVECMLKQMLKPFKQALTVCKLKGAVSWNLVEFSNLEPATKSSSTQNLLLRTMKDGLNKTANTKGGRDGENWRRLKWLAIIWGFL